MGLEGKSDSPAGTVSWTAKPKRLGQLVLDDRLRTPSGPGTGPGASSAPGPDQLIDESLWEEFHSCCPAAKRFGPLEHEALCLTSLIVKELGAKRSSEPVRFRELCCGKGLLTHSLNKTGVLKGKGLDYQSRPEWQKLSGGRGDIHEERKLDDSTTFEDVELVIAVRPHELTLVVPKIAANSGADFVIIPCCFVGPDGTTVATPHDSTSFEAYTQTLAYEASRHGFDLTTKTLELVGTGKLMVVIGRAFAT